MDKSRLFYNQLSMSAETIKYSFEPGTKIVPERPENLSPDCRYTIVRDTPQDVVT